MIEMKVCDYYGWYTEDNYQFLYASLKGIGDLVFMDYQLSEFKGSQKECLKYAVEELCCQLDIPDVQNISEIFKYFYYDTYEIVGKKRIYRQRKDRINELAKLAGF